MLVILFSIDSHKKDLCSAGFFKYFPKPVRTKSTRTRSARIKSMRTKSMWS